MNEENKFNKELLRDRELLFKTARNIKNEKDFVDFLKIFEGEIFSYDKCADMVIAKSLAYTNKLLCENGCTGFQAGFVGFNVLRELIFSDNSTGLRILDYDKMLYPQYKHVFDRTITTDTWKDIQKEAQKKLDEKDTWVHIDVVKHWESIVEGNLPFGFTIDDSL